MVADLWCLEITAFYVVLPLSLFYNPFCSISLPIPPPLPDLPPYSPHSTFSLIPFPLPPPSFFYFLRLFLGLRTKSFTAIKKTQRSSSDFDRWRWFRVDWMLQLNSDYSISPRVRKSPRIDENYNANKRIDGKVRETARWLFAVRPRSNGCVDTLFKLMVSNWTVSGAALLY